MARLATRRIRLNGDSRAAAAARVVVTDVLNETDLTDLLDDALLLTTELTANAVRHAGTSVDLRVEVDGESLRVTVGDGARGKFPAVDVDEMLRRPYATGGRGLAMVDRVASTWGTAHHSGGKVVWFELRRDDRDPARAAGPRPDAEPDGPLVFDVEPASDERVTRALERLVATGDCVAARVRLDRRDGTGEETAASYGTRTSDMREARVPLPLSPPWTGTLAVYTNVRNPSAHLRHMAEIVAESVALALDNDRLRREGLQRRASLRFAAIASELLAQSLDIDLTSALVPRLIVPRLGEWCAVFRPGADGELEYAAATHVEEAKTAFIETALAHPANVAVMRDALTRNAHGTLTATIDGIAVPLVVRDRRLGVLAVGRPAEHRHTPDELAAVEDLARRAALALDNAALHADRQRVARTLQQSLLPPSLPDVAGMRFGAEYIPALGVADVGGDFYDVLTLPSGGNLMVIGDVSGKGVAAAAVTGLIRDVFRILVRDERPCPEILCRLNDTLKERGTGRFATLAIAEITPAGDDLCARVYLAGHDKMVLVRADGRTEAVGESGTAIGLLDEIAVNPVDVLITPGDTLVTYTDGVTERRRGDELFGLDRLHEALARLGGHDADIVAARLRAATIAFSDEPPRDDIAILTLHHTGVREPAGPRTPITVTALTGAA